MKRLLSVLVLSTALSGCVLVDAYLMAKYDPSEYSSIATIRADAEKYKTQCDDQLTSKNNAISLADKTRFFEIYSEQIPRNENGINASKSLNEIAQELKTRYTTTDKVSVMYCKLKFGGIASSASTIQHVIGNRPR